METKDIILELRAKKGMSQEELAEKVFVTRQAVSRWETGETVPNTETLKQLSKLLMRLKSLLTISKKIHFAVSARQLPTPFLQHLNSSRMSILLTLLKSVAPQVYVRTS